MENSSISSEISTKSARMRAKTLFEMLPKIKEAYTLICSLRSVFSNRSIDRGAAKVKLHDYIATDLCNCAGLAQYFEHTTEIINTMKGLGCAFYVSTQEKLEVFLA